MPTQQQTELAAGTWNIDLAHSSAGFSVRHMMVSKVRGQFSAFDGAIVVADDPLASTVEATIEVESIDTRDPKRDAHLRSPDFFDAENYPQITFRSTGLETDGDDVKLNGDLTIKGVTRPITLAVEVGGVLQDPWGLTRAGFTASGTLNRSEFGLEWNAALETGGVVIGDKVTLDLDIEATLST
ncbi:YceI family protein [soil metagenome]